MSEENNVTTTEQQITPMQTQNVKTDTANVTPEQAKTTEQKSEVTYSKNDYDSMAVKQYNAGITKAMKDAGFDGATEDDFKKNLKAFKAWQDSQKTELQLAQEAAETAKKEKDVLQAELNLIRFENYFKDKGVPAGLIKLYSKEAGKLVDENTDLETAGAKVIEENPWPAVEEKPKETLPPYIIPTQGKAKAAKQEIDMNQLLFGRFKKA